MTLRHVLTSSATLALLLAFTTSNRAQQAAQPAAPPAVATSPQVLDVQGGKIRVTAIATGLVHPWSLAFLPD